MLLSGHTNRETQERRMRSIQTAESASFLALLHLFLQSAVVVAHPPSARKHASPKAGCHSNLDTFKLSLLL